MPNRNIVVGQKVDQAKVQRARELRHQMTEAERILWQSLRANRFSGLHFRRQQIVDGFIVDFYCHTAGLVIEVDGGIHEQQMEKDVERELVLSGRGLHVLRVRNEEVTHDIAGVLAKIAQSAGGPNPLAPFPGREVGISPLPASGRGRGRG